jgi:hypothetical protein
MFELTLLTVGGNDARQHNEHLMHEDVPNGLISTA